MIFLQSAGALPSVLLFFGGDFLAVVKHAGNSVFAGVLSRECEFKLTCSFDLTGH